MKRSDTLKITKGEKIARMEEILAAAKEGEKNRALKKEEKTEFETLKREVENLENEIEQAEFVEARAKEDDTAATTQHQRAGKIEKPEVKRKAAPYSVGKAIKEFARRGDEGLTGVEKEQHDELARGISSEGLLVPYMESKRDQNASNNDDSIDVRIDPNLSIIGKEPLWSQMGLTILPGLQGTIKLGKKIPDEAEKVVEKSEITETANTESFVTMSPERYGITDIFTKELLAQRNPAVQAAIVYDMVKGTDRKLSADVYTIALVAASEVADGDLTVDGFNALMGAVDLDGAFAMDRASFFEAKGVKVDTGSGRFLASMGGSNGVGQTYDGANIYYSSLFDDGDAKQYVIYGAFEEIYLGFWGALEILLNPYTYQKKGQIEMTVNRLADVICRNSSAFVVSPDLDEST
jgi:hypothetical protein